MVEGVMVEVRVEAKAWAGCEVGTEGGMLGLGAKRRRVG